MVKQLAVEAWGAESGSPACTQKAVSGGIYLYSQSWEGRDG